MTITNGQAVDAATDNPAFMSRTAVSTSTVSVVKHEAPTSATINDIQLLANRTATAAGVDETTSDGTTYGAPANTITDGDNHETALTKLANFFDGLTGHTHNGVDGNGPKILFDNINGLIERFGSATTVETKQAIGQADAATNITGLVFNKDDVQTFIGWITIVRRVAATEGRRSVVLYIGHFNTEDDAWTVNFPQIAGTANRSGVTFTFTDIAGVVQIKEATDTVPGGGAYTGFLTHKTLITFDTE